MNISDELYQQVILDHNKKPRNFGKLEGATHFAEGFNPLCGDHYNVYLTVDDSGIIENAMFEGSGCAISKASASMMTQAIKGQTIEFAKSLFDQFHKLVTGETVTDDGNKLLGKLQVFAGVCRYPARVKCAALSWHTLTGAIDESQDTVTTE